MGKPKSDFLAIFKTLAKHEVDFIVVGGVCGVLHGAPISTFDLDLVHSREPNNIERLMASLESLGAYYPLPYFAIALFVLKSDGAMRSLSTTKAMRLTRAHRRNLRSPPIGACLLL